MSPEIAARESARPATGGSFDSEADIVVVGGGGGGLPTALFSRWHGNEVILLEKAPELGGTAKKAAFWYWVPNNAAMRAAGLTDEKDDFLRYVARLSRPTRYDPDSPTLGLSEWEHSMASAIYDSASDATELLAARDALPYRHCPAVPDYWSELPEDKAPYGRVLVPVDASESMADGGENAVRTLSAAAARDCVDVRTGHRVQRVIIEGGRVVGVEASTTDGTTHRIGARKAVIFASGGFTHDDDLRTNFLGVPAYRGCAAATNEGDFVRIGTTVGAQLRNMNYAWMCPVPLERSGRPDLVGMFSVAGDSMLFVDKTGRRAVNEKLPYNELAQAFFRWDGTSGEYPNLVLVQIWDQRSQEHSASTEYGRLIVPPGTDDSHVIRGETLEELSTAIAERLATVAAKTGGLRLAEGFGATLKDTVARYNEQAAAGRDTDFHRGETAIQAIFNGPVKEEPGRENPTLWPLAEQGPYYAALVTGGTLDTKGGPRTDPDGRVLDDTGAPVPGLYGVGNCVASASAQAYWAGGATLGPIIAFAHRAANAAHTESR
ncbi:FAD-dependent oxidoreductase [Pseudonocardia spinosispora]|uniref:FAD-dependent oxidoreductase n=1 Tax=Pseudonocardia spinosispora TaxID=103441 RepID=UPI000400EFBC|nr:FAD-dependent oxidoreductase [Pseudonocardia spinosispora]